MIGDKTPCGLCDVGIYSEIAMLNKNAISFLVIDEREREKIIPQCKSRDIPCVGYCDLHSMKKGIDRVHREMDGKNE